MSCDIGGFNVTVSNGSCEDAQSVYDNMIVWMAVFIALGVLTLGVFAVCRYKKLSNEKKYQYGLLAAVCITWVVGMVMGVYVIVLLTYDIRPWGNITGLIFAFIFSIFVAIPLITQIVGLLILIGVAIKACISCKPVKEVITDFGNWGKNKLLITSYRAARFDIA